MQATRCYRVHPAGEAHETVLDPARKDGWVSSDETHETQPRGVSACLSLADLLDYMRMYSLTPQPGDVVLELRGTICGRDRDLNAVRVEVSEIVAVHPLSVLDVPSKWQIEDLRDESDDQETIQLCADALGGDSRALLACQKIIG